MQTISRLPLQPGPDTINQAQSWLEQLARQMQWPARVTFGLSLSLDEALTNVVMYGFPAGIKGSAAISLVLRSDADTIVLDIIDNGIPFDPTARESPELAPSLDQAVAGGHGLRLMRHYLDNIEYRHEHGCNHLLLTASLRPADDED